MNDFERNERKDAQRIMDSFIGTCQWICQIFSKILENIFL